MPILPNHTLSSIVNLAVVQPPLNRATFTLDSSGVAGFFGGESAVRAMGTAYLIPQRRWLGWYNAPGAYEVAKQYSGLAKSHLFNALFPGDNSDPAKILMVDGQVGPEYTPLYSPTGKAPSPIGHLGSLIARKVSQMPVTGAVESGTKGTMDARVTIVNLKRIVPSEFSKLQLFPSSSIIFTVFTILISVGGCVACALVADWFCFASIALGIIANGVACLVMGSGKLYLKNNPSPQAHSPGDVLLKSDTNIILLVGCEGMVRPFTHGRFVLLFGGTPLSGLEKARAPSTTAEKGRDRKGDTPKPNPLISIALWSKWILQKCLTVDTSVILLLFQFLAQLLLIPQGTLFGQLMFLGTLVPSWMYHSYLSTLGLDLQTQALFAALSIQESNDIFQYQFNTWTQAAVFACLFFRSTHPPVWHSSNSNSDEQRPEDAEAEKKKSEAHERDKKLERAQISKGAHAGAAEAAAKAARAHDVAAAELSAVEKYMEASKLEMEVAEGDVEAAEKEVEAAVAAVAAMEEVKVAQQAQAQTEEKTAQDKKAAAQRVVMEKEADVEKKKEEVQKIVQELKKKEPELKKKKAEALKTEAARIRTECEENTAKVAADADQATVTAMYSTDLDKVQEDDEKTKKQQHDGEMARQQKNADKAFQTLLDALLPGQTDVWRAFKQSLVRKLSKANDNLTWEYMESRGALVFNDGDIFASDQGGTTSKELVDKDLTQLHGYQDDAKSAFAEWRNKRVV